MNSGPKKKIKAQPPSVRGLIRQISPAEVAELRPDSELVAELGYDSLDLVELLVTLEDTLELPSIDLELLAELARVEDVERIVAEARSQMSPGKEPA